MREPPPDRLAALLTRLGLATQGDFERVESAVHRMAGDLPRFESVWVDALRQARVLTHFQAAEIHAGRGEALAVVRYVLCQPVQECGYAALFRAEDLQTREIVRLAVFPPPSQDQEALLPKLEKLIAVGKGLAHTAGIIVACGPDGSRFWAASPWVDGTSLADFVLHHGRFPPEAVLEIARAMLDELVVLEAAGLVHGDIRLQTVLIANDGEIGIPHPGLRGTIRPQEGISYHDLAPDACSTLAPERVTEGTPPTVASDLFACGCVWWHLLCGRPPLGGGDTLARLRAAQAAAVDDLHQWAADVPDALVEAIGACLQKDPRKRPQSMANLGQRLGPLRRHGRRTIARCRVAAARPRAPWLRSKRTRGRRRRIRIASRLPLWPCWLSWRWPGRCGWREIVLKQTRASPHTLGRRGRNRKRQPSRPQMLRRREKFVLDRSSIRRLLRPDIPLRVVRVRPQGPATGTTRQDRLKIYPTVRGKNFACPPTGPCAANCCS